jgi:ABC-type nickel/cobalt efflux system permease component RcnA
METISTSDVILGLVSFIILILSGGFKMLWNKVGKNEEKIDQNREQMHSEMKDIYAKHDTSSEKVRTEINNLATSLRADMVKQSEAMTEQNKSMTTILLQIAQKNGS